MSMLGGSSSPNVVTLSDSSARPTSRPTTTTVSADLCSSSTLHAIAICSRRLREAGL